jgi:hypothetical protein
MKFVEREPLSDPAAARKLVEIANGLEPCRTDRIHIELINGVPV